MAIGGSLAGGQIPVSVQASVKKEQEASSTKQENVKIESLSVTYMFPRAGIEMDIADLELDEDCLSDVRAVTTLEERDRFFEHYGVHYIHNKAYPWGFLYSTQNINDEERKQIEKIKNTTRIAAGLSVQTPWAGAGDYHLTWDSHGGDTTLCSDPPRWVSSVRDYRLWRPMDQHRFVRLESIIQSIALGAFSSLNGFSTRKNDGINRNITANRAYSDEVRDALLDALRVNNNPISRKIRYYFEEGEYKQKDLQNQYNEFRAEFFPHDPRAEITNGLTFTDLFIDQKVGLGLYMVHEEQLTWCG
uniref:MACPF domain-containing protein n=1 Tax=Bionectria ochroleuca TaxID=29856 RepID=A0A8H7N5V9_BIOOC